MRDDGGLRDDGHAHVHDRLLFELPRGVVPRYKRPMRLQPVRPALHRLVRGELRGNALHNDLEPSLQIVRRVSRGQGVPEQWLQCMQRGHVSGQCGDPEQLPAVHRVSGRIQADRRVRAHLQHQRRGGVPAVRDRDISQRGELCRLQYLPDRVRGRAGLHEHHAEDVLSVLDWVHDVCD